MTVINKKKSIEDIEFKDKEVLIRVDFNVPLKDGTIKDSFRITSAIPTIKSVLSQAPKRVILVSHLGRPNGKVTPSLSFKPLVPQINTLFSKQGIESPLEFLDLDLSLENKYPLAEFIPERSPSDPPSLYLIENIRFYPEEESKSISEVSVQEFRRKLSSLGSIFVFDAFGCSHRGHSSVSGVSMDERVAGLLMKKECSYLGQFLEASGSSKEEMAVILGGAKVSDKVKLIESLLNTAGTILIGGGMANTFLFHGQTEKAAPRKVLLGNSLVEKGEEASKTVRRILSEAKEKDVALVLPVDFRTKKGMLKTFSRSDDGGEKLEVEEDDAVLDIGDKTVSLFLKSLEKAKKIFWNGPMGKFEEKEFSKGTFSLLTEVARLGANVVIGGGDTAAATHMLGEEVESKVYVSTGGGASLEMLEGRELPGLEMLSDK